MWQAPYIRKFLNRHRSDGSGGLKNGIDEPTYVSFWVDFVISPENDVVAGDYNTMPHGLLNAPNNGNGYSTEEYLRNLGYYIKANNIKAFRELLHKIVIQSPWTINSIGGLDSIYKTDITSGWTKRGKEGKIRITMTDSLDMRVSALMDLYKLSAVDEEYGRDLLPDIMKYFKMRIHVSEFRMFHEPKVKNTFLDPGGFEENVYKSTTSKLNPFTYIENNAPSSILPNTRIGREVDNLFNIASNQGRESIETDGYFLQKLDKELSLFRFDLSQCEIDIASIKPSWADELGNKQIGEPVSLTFDIKVGNVDYMGSYPVIYSLLESSLKNSNFNSNITNSGFGTNNPKELRSKKEIDSYSEILQVSRGYTSEEIDKVYAKKSEDGHLSDIKVTQNNINDTLARLGENLLEGAAEMVIGAADDYILTEANKLLLGNVYGLSPSQLINRLSSNPASLALAAQDLIGRSVDPATGQSILGNIYGNGDEPSEDLDPDQQTSVYGEGSEPSENLDPKTTQNINGEGVKDSNFSGTATDDSNVLSKGILGPRS